jgi:hypothetical protein
MVLSVGEIFLVQWVMVAGEALEGDGGGRQLEGDYPTLRPSAAYPTPDPSVAVWGGGMAGGRLPYT